jgi:hypothetical protein
MKGHVSGTLLGHVPRPRGDKGTGQGGLFRAPCPLVPGAMRRMWRELRLARHLRRRHGEWVDAQELIALVGLEATRAAFQRECCLPWPWRVALESRTLWTTVDGAIVRRLQLRCGGWPWL